MAYSYWLFVTHNILKTVVCLNLGVCLKLHVLVVYLNRHFMGCTVFVNICNDTKLVIIFKMLESTSQPLSNQ